MLTVEELTEKVKTIYDELCELRDKEKASSFNFEKFDKKDLAKPIKNHILTEKTDFIKEIYLTMIAFLIRETADERIREKQRFHFARIGKSAGFNGKKLNEFFFKAATVDEKILVDLCENFDGDLADMFIIDCILTGNISGKKEERELELLGNIISLLGIGRERLKILCECAKNILINDADEVIRIKELNTIYLAGYTNKEFDGKFVRSLKDVKGKEKQPIYIFNDNISNLSEELNLDNYAKECYFYNCEFENIFSVVSNECKSNFINCTFKNIHRKFEVSGRHVNKKALIEIKNGEFINCKFDDCKVNTSILCMNGGIIKECSFINCHANYVEDLKGLLCLEYTNVFDTSFVGCKIDTIEERSSKYTTIVILKNGQMENCVFDACNSHIRMSYGFCFLGQFAYTVVLKDSVIKNSKFIKCESYGFVDGSHYLSGLSLINSNAKNNTFEDCKYKSGNMCESKDSWKW